MKKFITLLGLFALTAVVSALAAESAPPTIPFDLITASPACSAVATSSVPSTQPSELPSWLASNPLLWAEAQAAGCVSYCVNTCEGCCAFPAPGVCACC
jgi:hypothetical protein